MILTRYFTSKVLGMISLTPGLFFNAETAEILAENAEKIRFVFFRVFRVAW